MTCSIN